jgi:hypothetical protein
MIACSAWLMLLPSAVWDYNALLQPQPAMTDPSAAAASLVEQRADLGGLEMVGAVLPSLGALLSMVLAFRSNLSRLPPPPAPAPAPAPPPAPAAAGSAGSLKIEGIADGELDKDDGGGGTTQGEQERETTPPAVPAAASGVELAVRRLAEWVGVAQAPGPFEGEFCRLIGQHQQWFLFDRPSRDDHWFVTLGARKTPSFELFSYTKSEPLYQDRLGTNIGKALKKGRFLQGAAKMGLPLTSSIRSSFLMAAVAPPLQPARWVRLQLRYEPLLRPISNQRSEWGDHLA